MRPSQGAGHGQRHLRSSPSALGDGLPAQQCVQGGGASGDCPPHRGRQDLPQVPGKWRDDL